MVTKDKGLNEVREPKSWRESGLIAFGGVEVCRAKIDRLMIKRKESGRLNVL
jgi:hypothetical protein